jgi:ElaB/YqjD/DUF883 family membrane-anchored ribosome-binding protein
MDQSLSTQYKDTKNNVAKNVNSFKEEAKNDVSKASTALTEKVKAGAEDLSKEFGTSTAQIKDRLVQLRDAAGDKIEVATDFAKKHPIACIAGATLIGYAVGRLVTRKQ